MQLHRMQFQHATKIAQGFVKLFFTRNLLSVVKLAAYLVRLIKQMHFMAALCSIHTKRQASRACANHGNFFTAGCRGKIKLSLVAGTRVNQTTCAFVLKHMVQTSLITGYAGINFIGFIGRCFINKVSIC